MKFGLLFRVQDPPDGSNLVQRWQEALQVAKVAEESGFDGLFLPEHHMMPDGYVSSVWPILGALAAVTERVDIGTTVQLLPLDHPIHVAEHGAMVDTLSNGRLRLGVGMANFPQEFELFGLNPKRQKSRFEEALEIVQRAWAGETISFHGKHFDIEASGPITPQRIGAELWLGAMSEPGVRRAAQFGVPWATDPLHNVDVMKYWADLYREAGEEFGTTDKQSVVLLRDGWVADSLDEVEKTWWPCIRSEHWFYFEKVPRWVAEREPFLQGIEKEEDFTFERHRQNRLVVGSPQDCIDSIQEFKDAIDMDYLITSFRVAQGPSFEEELEAIRRFGRDVIPAFKKVEAPTATA
jgi:alkanesulfonate monooxygenase SsuD/methylene tetrahydromethanopterin reductase-like flavin-dependent oxidoreductase (luciferase family)